MITKTTQKRSSQFLIFLLSIILSTLILQTNVLSQQTGVLKQNLVDQYLKNKNNYPNQNDKEQLKKRRKIIHISDLHYGRKQQNENLPKLVNHIKNKFGGQADEIVILITGDLIDVAIKKTKNKVEKYYNKQFQVVINALDNLRQLGFQVLVVPGNHDFKIKDKTYKGKYQTRNNNYACLEAKQAFKNVFYEQPESSDIDYPALDIIDGIAYIGINAMDAEPNLDEDKFIDLGYSLYYKNDKVNIGIGKKQLKNLDKLINAMENGECEACRSVVFYLHHLKKPGKSQDYHTFFHIITKLKKIKVAAIFAGHTHESTIPNKHWNKKIPTFVAGTATNECDDAQILAGKCDTQNIFVEFTENGDIKEFYKFKFSEISGDL